MLFHLARLAVWLRHPRARHALIGCGAGIGLMLAFGTAALVVMSRQHAMQDAAREVQNLAFVLAEETDRAFGAAELVQLDLIAAMRQRNIDTADRFATAMATEAVHNDLQRRIAALRQVAALALLDRTGKIINMSRQWPAASIDASDRDFFQAIAKAPAQHAYIGAPVRDRVSGAMVTIFAHPYTASDGQLLGVVAVAMELAPFDQLFSCIAINPGSSVALWRNDGVLLARYPRQTAVPIGTDYSVVHEFRRSMATRDQGVVVHASLIDAKPRLVAPHSVAHYPLMLAVTETTEAVLADWRRLAFGMVAGTILTELVLTAIVLLGVRQLGVQERLNVAYANALESEAARVVAESELARAQDRASHEHDAHLKSMRFHTTLANMLQGLVMFDGNHRLLVVNPRFNALAGLEPDALHSGMDYAAFVQAVADHGDIPRDDLMSLLSRRGETIDQRKRSSTTWELSDGRVFSITHQPMEEGWLATYEDISERRRVDERLAYMARHDTLTDLPNRTLFHERLEHALGFARRGRLVALLCLDLDQFKQVNDTLGHPVGDALLQAVAQRLLEQIRDIDTIARLGGDEFAIIQTAIDKPGDAAVFASRLLDLLEQPFPIGEHRIAINTSIGIAFAPQDGVDADVLMKNAELALYRSKVGGRRTYRMFQAQMDTEMQARRIMETELREALTSGQFELFYQPLVAVTTRSASGFEALLRWRHPKKGLIAPSAFIPLAEETGLIVPIGEWVLRQACATAKGWPNHVRVAVNLSPVQFADRKIVHVVAAALCDSGLDAGRLELEITETAILEDTEATLAILHELRALGVQIALDDFGTGFSSLSYLRRFPFDRIKIDQSFVRELGKQRDCGAIVRAVIGLSRDLGIAITAEGVETDEQMRALVIARCTDLQGYLFSPPVPQQEVPRLLRTLGPVTEIMSPIGLVA
jgi:diguanylate cyclase (GGDEF)-like protein